MFANPSPLVGLVSAGLTTPHEAPPAACISEPFTAVPSLTVTQIGRSRLGWSQYAGNGRRGFSASAVGRPRQQNVSGQLSPRAHCAATQFVIKTEKPEQLSCHLAVQAQVPSHLPL
ncbi:hypothetical protein GQ53DRAFT_299897 [Thozetella sp. PMI_491]|nr:hypothetical protein GQ53DRAFT_299897 [Thozetella sp. PMI_491]